MNLAKFSVERPVTVAMIVAGLLIFGVISLQLLPQELFPQIVYPQLTVVTPYGNAAPEEIETLITRPIEEAVGTVAGVRRINSISREGLSLVIAEFGWNQNINFAALGMREKIDLIKERLPREAEEPTVLPFNPFDKPILILSVTSDSDRSPLALRTLTERMIKDEIEKVDGVASALLSGGQEREIQVEIDHDKLLARGVPILDVSKSISNANLNYPAGTIKESFYEYLIRTLGEFQHVRDLEEVAIGSEEDPQKYYKSQAQIDEEEVRGISSDKRLIYLKDVATIHDGVKERTSYSRYNGNENVSISIQKQAMGNTVRTITRVKKRVAELQADLPNDITVAIVYDQSDFIKSSITGVWNAAWQGGVLVFLILFYFLRNAWSAAIVTLTIPISVMATFAMMFFSGISLNMMSLGGLAFGVGSLVDSAIVVVENIYRHMQMGEDRHTAAIQGTNEVFIAVTGSVMTTIVVFLPLIFVIGIIGQISKDFALTVTFSLLSSLVASMTVIPLLASRGMKLAAGSAAGRDEEAGTVEEKGIAAKIGVFYERLLGKFIRRRGPSFLRVFLVFAISCALFVFLDKELMPKVDQGQFMIKLTMPGGTRLAVTNKLSEEIETFIMTIPEVESVNVTVGSTRESSSRHVMERLSQNEAEIAVTLYKKRQRTSNEVVQVIKEHIEAMGLEGVKVEYVLSENVLMTGMGASAPVTVEIKGDDLGELEQLTHEVQRGLGRIDGIYGIKNSLAEPSPETKIFVDKDRASVYGLSVTDIAQTALIGLKGYISSQFKEGGQEYDIRVRLAEKHRDDFEKLGRMRIQSPFGMSVPLASVASFGKGKGPSEIKRINQERVIYVYANIYDRSQKDVFADVDTLIERMRVPKDYTVKLTGETEEMKASFNSMRNAIIAAFLLVFMIMAALFESLWQPFIILFTIPLAVIGVAWLLFFTQTSVSAYVLMGIGILGGIVVNNAIVLIDCINLFRTKGMSVKDAVVRAAKVRTRPIFMTAMTTILGLMPMAFLGGEGAELRAPMAVTVIGGLLAATFLTLVVIPTIYLSLVERFEKLFKKKR